MARSIQEISNKFKLLLQDDRIFYGALILLVAGSSFGLGRLSDTQNNTENAENKPIIMQQAAAGAPLVQKEGNSEVLPERSEAEGLFVGSKNGTKYHLLWCPGAKQIKEENKVFFSSKEEAERAGYSPAANCKGL